MIDKTGMATPYDGATYAVEAEPIATNITWLDLPHWFPVIENPANLSSVNSLIQAAPFWLWDILKLLQNLYQSMNRDLSNKRYRGYEAFMEMGTPHACLVNLSDPVYQNYKGFPAHIPEYDMAGSIEMSEDDEFLLEAGEIKSSHGCKVSLNTHHLLKLPGLTYFSIRSWEVATGEPDEVTVPGTRHRETHSRHRNIRVIFPQVRRAMETLNLDVRTDRSSLRDHPTDIVCESKADRQMVDIDGNIFAPLQKKNCRPVKPVKARPILGPRSPIFGK